LCTGWPTAKIGVMLNYESLHNHTTSSDGTQDYLDVLAAAEQHGLGVMALTDHDALPGEQDLARLRAYDGPVQWLVGIEITSYVPREVGGPERGALHVLGLFVDPTNRPLVEFCARAEEGRRVRMRAVIKHLQGIGFRVTEEDVLRHAPSKNIVLPHMVSAVMEKPENRKLADEIRERMRVEAEHDAEVKRAYDDMMEFGPKQYPYALFMTRHAYVPLVQDEVVNLLDLDRTVKLIREAGGVAVMGHWFFNENKLSEAGLAAVLNRGGLDGLESVIVNTMGDKAPDEDVRRTRELIRRFGVAETMGSDSHSAADLEAFAGSKFAPESVGQTARLIERFKPDLHWSNWA